MTRFSIRTALMAGLMLGAAVPAFAASGPKLTSDVAKALSDVQKANTAKDYAAAQAGLDKAKAVSGRTPYDDLMINRFAMGVHVGTKDFVAADADAEAAADADPSIIPDADKMAVYKPALQLALSQKHYDKAVKYTHILQAMTPPPDAETQAMFPQALYLGGDKAGAAELAKKNIAAAKAAGTRPARNDLDILMGAQVQAKDEAGAEDTLETLVSAYNEPDDWGQIIGVSFGMKGMREIDYVYLGRVGLLVGAKLSQNDANLIGGVANSNKLALYGDAAAVQKLGGPAPDPRMAADRKSVPDQIKVGQGAKGTGEYNAKLAEVLYGYGMYPEAEAAARLAQQKGGTSDANEPAMVIGMAQAAQGKYADAQATFSQINPPGAPQVRVVRLWVDYVKSKQAPATATAQ